jgi:A/G-specific adenine glycosylase
VLAAWAGLGYYARARNLHACAQAVVRNHNGAFPANASGLMALPGIGPYTAAAIAAICFDENVAVVDGNVERVMARVLALKVPVREAKNEIRAAVQASVPKRAGDFAQALMDLGATVCAPKSPNCSKCPLRETCAARASGNPAAYPVAAPRAERPRRYGHAFVIERADGAVWLVRRPEKGMLGAMTGVPGSEWSASVRATEFPVDARWREAGRITHVFTHFALTLTVWHTRAGAAPEGEGWWAKRARLAGEALPTLYRKVLAEAGIDVRPVRRRA